MQSLLLGPWSSFQLQPVPMKVWKPWMLFHLKQGSIPTQNYSIWPNREGRPLKERQYICKCSSVNGTLISSVIPARLRSRMYKKPRVLSCFTKGCIYWGRIGPFEAILHSLCRAWTEAEPERRILLQKGKDMPGVEKLSSDSRCLSSGGWKKEWNQKYKCCCLKKLCKVLALLEE